MQENPDQVKFDAIQEINRQARLSQSDYIYVQTGTDVLREAFQLLKLISSEFTSTVIQCLDQVPQDKPLLKLSIIKSYLMTSKLGNEYDATHENLLSTIRSFFRETESNEVKVLCIENISLLMVTQRKVFNENLDWF